MPIENELLEIGPIPIGNAEIREDITNRWSSRLGDRLELRVQSRRNLGHWVWSAALLNSMLDFPRHIPRVVSMTHE